MKKTPIIIVLILIILALVIYKFNFNKNDSDIENSPVTDVKNATYIIDGKNITLKNGISEIEITPGSASKLTTQYFGNEVKHDFDADGREDVAFILTQSTGGTGTFYYVVAALNTPSGYVGSEGLLLGDRIAPQTTEMGKGNIIVVNYADRKPGEDFGTAPSVGKSIWLILDPKTMQFGEVEQNFEGEADPGKMNLNMKTWTWINTLYSDSKEVKPMSTKKFTLTFGDQKRFSATTDCNSVAGEYVVDGNKISFSKMISTKMYCEKSQESDFTKMLGEAESYHFTSKGELIFDLEFDSGSMIFR